MPALFRAGCHITFFFFDISSVAAVSEDCLSIDPNVIRPKPNVRTTTFALCQPLQVELMMLTKSIRATRRNDTTLTCAEFMPDTGRLRILRNDLVVAEWFPPHSWFEIASVAGYSAWGTRPNERDLALLLEGFESRYVSGSELLFPLRT
jgi:hypothetical protein